MKTTRNTRRGFTLLEVVIASVILMAVTLMTFMLLFSSSEEQVREQAKVKMDADVLSVLNLIAKDIRDSGPPYSNLDAVGADTPLVVGDAFFDPTLTPALQRRFSISLGRYSGFNVSGKLGTAQFNTIVRYYWRPAFGEIPDNGIDDNRDGYTDDGEIVREETPAGGPMVPSVICRNVGKRGLAFEMVNGANPPKAIRIFVQLLGLDQKGKILTSQSSVSAGPRN